MPQKRARGRATASQAPPFAPLDVTHARTYPIERRRSKVAAQALAQPVRPTASIAAFLAGLPRILAADELRAAARAIATAHRRGRLVVVGMGAHVIKVGLSPILIDLMERGIVGGLAMNGACIVHDFELAYHGATSEDVAAGLEDGHFGMARETGVFLNGFIRDGAARGLGLGQAVGRAILDARLPHRRLSLLAAASRLGVPATVHVAIGTDIIHMHPGADGAAIGATSLQDFRLLAAVVARMHGGVFVNLGSAVVIPEVFVKALNLARNLGRRVGELTCIDMDFIRQYRPRMNVVGRPTAGGGRGIELTGHHEIMVPLLAAAVLAEVGGGGPSRRGGRAAVARRRTGGRPRRRRI
jgi:hypothetical protein